MKVKKTVNGTFIPKDEKGNYAFGNISSQYGATERYFTKNGKPWLPIIGEFHFSRYEEDKWDTELAKLKTQGLDGVAVYVFWNHHEISPAYFDFTGNRNIHKFLQLCKKHSLVCVLRIGPWCHGEVRLGGFPDYLRLIVGKRKSTCLYMRYVKRFWKALFEEVKDFCDGESIVGIQLENEYPGNLSHIVDLRNIAQEIGFKTPYFTMTAWPTNTPDIRFVPMFGGYPEAPWTQNKKPLVASRRFAICEGRSEIEIGEDINKSKGEKGDFSSFPYATCEIGVGNQPTNHRRPIISSKDGYGVAFSKFASGANWLGYYMYHGGRNPNQRPMQESRRTFYPNNYPIIDYDFQAPFSKDGKIREHGNKLRLLHYFIKSHEDILARSQTFFANEREFPYFSVRYDGNSGFVFISNYERNLISEECAMDISVNFDGDSFSIRNLQVANDSMFYIPIGYELNGMRFDYITAQPIIKIIDKDDVHCYFMKIKGVDTRISVAGVEKICESNECVFEVNQGRVILHFLEENEAERLYCIDNKIFFSPSPIYSNGIDTVAELIGGESVTYMGKTIADAPKKDIGNAIRLKEIKPVKLKYNSYMFSRGKRKCYQIEIDKNCLIQEYDIEIILEFEGLNLQMFHKGQIVDDYFNTDGKFTFRIARLKDRLLQDNKLIIRTCAKTRKGSGNPYNEIYLQDGNANIRILKTNIIFKEELNYEKIN